MRVNDLLRLVVDGVLAPATLLSAWYFLLLRKNRLVQLPITRTILGRIGVYPLLDHYYEPLFRTQLLDRKFHDRRVLPAVDLNVAGQLAWLARFRYGDELRALPRDPPADAGPGVYYYRNGAFEAGDGEFLYSLIRYAKPKRLIEIGCGHSTRMAQTAIARNVRDNPAHVCRHICIEPYENDWLEQLGVEVLRERVETLDLRLFTELQAGDILFIDSSHIIRPQGDVLFEILQVLPSLAPGVFIHVHDVFTPCDYPNKWVIDSVRFWNEQYLLEAFLSFNDRFEVIGALGHLAAHYPRELAAAFPVFPEEQRAGRGGKVSFWMRRSR